MPRTVAARSSARGSAGRPGAAPNRPRASEGRRVEIIQVSAPLRARARCAAGYLTTLLGWCPWPSRSPRWAASSSRSRLAPCGRCPGPRVRSPPRIWATARRRGAEDEIDHLADTLNTMLARSRGGLRPARRFSAERRTSCVRLSPRSRESRGGASRRSSPENPDGSFILPRGGRAPDPGCGISALLAPRRPSASRGTRVDLEPIVLEALEAGGTARPPVGVRYGRRYRAHQRFSARGGALRRAVRPRGQCRQFTPGGGKVSLSLPPGPDGRALIVVRTRASASIPPTGRASFDPFVRLDAARSRCRGSGPRLALVRSIAAAHGGTVDVESTRGRAAGSPSASPSLRSSHRASSPSHVPLLRLLAAGRSSLHTRGGRKMKAWFRNAKWGWPRSVRRLPCRPVFSCARSGCSRQVARRAAEASAAAPLRVSEPSFHFLPLLCGVSCVLPRANVAGDMRGG